MNNLQVSLGKVFLLSKLFSLFPLRQGVTGFTISPWLLTFSVVHVSLMAWWYTEKVLFFEPPSLVELVFGNFLLKVQFGLHLTHAVLTLVVIFTKVDQLNEIVKDLEYIDHLLSDYVTDLADAVSLRYGYCYVVGQAFLLVIDLNIYNDELSTSTIYYWFFVIMYSSVFQFRGFMEIFLLRFRVVVQRTKNQQRRKCPSSKELVKLCSVHRLLSECTQKTNKLYSTQLLVFCAATFANIISSSYFTIFISYSTDAFTVFMEKAVVVTWLYLSVHVFYMTIRKTQSITKQVINSYR